MESKSDFDLEKVRLAAQVRNLENRLLSANSTIERYKKELEELKQNYDRLKNVLDSEFPRTNAELQKLNHGLKVQLEEKDKEIAILRKRVG
jgi:predicted RNase H-like nuclease (RuvC/YqgF family)